MLFRVIDLSRLGFIAKPQKLDKTNQIPNTVCTGTARLVWCVAKITADQEVGLLQGNTLRPLLFAVGRYR